MAPNGLLLPGAEDLLAKGAGAALPLLPVTVADAVAVLPSAFFAAVFLATAVVLTMGVFFAAGIFYYRSFNLRRTANRRHPFTQCLSRFVAQHEGFHFFQRLRFDLAYALGAHTILSGQLVQGGGA